jgi:hypothetical protein
MDEKQFCKKLLALAELFDKELSQAVIGFYVSALEEFSDSEIDSALKTAALKCKFFPKPAELIELVNGPQEEQSLLAWEQLTAAVQLHGAYDSVMFADTKITRVVEALGGWITVCNWPVAELHFRRSEFNKLYQAARPLKEQRVLPGLVQLDNAGRGYLDKVPPPAVIGDDRKPLLRLVESR